MTEVYAEAVWTDLARRLRFANFPVLGKKPQEGLVDILKGSGWTAGDDPDPGGSTLYSREGFDETILSHLRGWAEITGYELLFDNVAQTVTLVESIGEDRGVGFRYGANVEEIVRRYEPPKATVLYPVGANSLTIATVEPSGEVFVEDFSWYVAQGLTVSQARNLHTKEASYVDEGILLPVNLLDRATEILAEWSQPTISYEVAVVDLSDAVGTEVPFEIGDTVRVRDEVFDVELSTRIVRRVYRPLAPGEDEVELSYLRGSTTEATQSREPSYDGVAILADQLGSTTVVGPGSTVDFAEIQFNTTGTATSVVGATFLGTASGTGTVRFSFIMDAIAVGKEYDVEFVDGEVVEFSWPSFAADLAAESHLASFRVQHVAGTGSVTVEAGEARGWLLTTGAFGLGVNTSPNRRIVEEFLAVDLTGELISETVAVALSAAIDVEEAYTLAAVDPLDIGSLSERYLLPFIIGDPEFGKLDGPGVIS